MTDVEIVSPASFKLVEDFCKATLRKYRYAQVSGGHDRQGAIVYLVNKDKVVFEVGAWKDGGYNITVVNTPYREIRALKGGKLFLCYLVGSKVDAESAVKMLINEARDCTLWQGEPSQKSSNMDR